MAQHVTTLNEIREGMDPTDTPSNTDLIYAERGTGSDRARAFQIREIGLPALTGTLNVDPTTGHSFGDITFHSTQTVGGTKLSADINDDAVDEDAIKNSLNLAQHVLNFLGALGSNMRIRYEGIEIFLSDQAQTAAYYLKRTGEARFKSLALAFDKLQQADDEASQQEYRSMTNCETHAGGTPTEYVTSCVTGGGGGGYDKFVLDSKNHEIGAVVIVTNTGRYIGGDTSSESILAYRQSDVSYSTPVAEIPVGHSKQFFYRGLDTNDNAVWAPLD